MGHSIYAAVKVIDQGAEMEPPAYCKTREACRHGAVAAWRNRGG
jgi:hypothetical protein